LDAIWKGSELFGRLRQPDLLEGKCGDCEYKADCLGCRARAFATRGNPFDEEPHCAWVPEARRPKQGAPHA
jgi:radical SAM protein with 4Fe4S-binding SPASM domain